MSQTEGEHLEKSLSKKLTSCGVQPLDTGLVFCSISAWYYEDKTVDTEI